MPTPAETGYSCSPANSGARNPDKSSAEHTRRELAAGSEEPETRAPASRNGDGLVMALAGVVPGAGRRGMSTGDKGHPRATSPGALTAADKDRIPSHPALSQPATGRALGLIINAGTGKSRSLPLPGPVSETESPHTSGSGP